jgi:hypothetical protein
MRPQAGVILLASYTDQKISNPERLVVAELIHLQTHCNPAIRKPQESAQIKLLFSAIVRLGRDLGIASDRRLVVTS